jgi:salicylate hydroxylase
VSARPGIYKTVGSMPLKRQILIAGGGIAGLTAALALEQRGFAVTVFERAPKLQSEGAGLQLSPNATRLLGRLKVLQRLAAGAVQVRRIDLMSGDAKTLLSLDVSASNQRWGAPYMAVHRADLAAALLSEAKSRPAISIRFGAEITHFAAHANGVTASVTTDQGIGECEGIFLIGADGANSKISVGLANGPPIFTGCIAHRRMVNADAAMPAPLRALLEQRIVAAFLAPRAHLVAYPLRGGTMLNLVLITRLDSGPASDPDGQGRIKEEVSGQFGADIAAFLSDGSAWTQWPLFVRAPSSKWSNGGPFILIGDAAHAMTPFGAQGAAMAIEDGWTLAACLHASRENLSLAPAAFEQLRRSRIRRIAARSALNGYAYHAHGLAAMARGALFRWRGQKMLDGLDWIYAYDASAAES